MQTETTTVRTPATHRVAVAMGGNHGDVRGTFALAQLWLAERGLRMTRTASVRVTRPVGCHPGTADFGNSAFVGEWAGTAADLLRLTQAAERHFGRPAQHDSRGDRTLDLDILLFDQEQVCSPRLTIPHPRLRERLFVLEPLAEIAPDWPVPPDLTSVADCLARLRLSAG